MNKLSEIVKHNLKNVYAQIKSNSGNCRPEICNSYCCTNTFKIMYVEYVNIIESLKENLSSDEVSDLLGKLTKQVDPKNFRIRECPLLDEDRKCMIYNARPYVCRIHQVIQTSSDELKCMPSHDFMAAQKIVTVNSQITSLPPELRLFEETLDFWLSRIPL